MQVDFLSKIVTVNEIWNDQFDPESTVWKGFKISEEEFVAIIFSRVLIGCLRLSICRVERVQRGSIVLS
jgi:hypothetical protein